MYHVGLLRSIKPKTVFVQPTSKLKIESDFLSLISTVIASCFSYIVALRAKSLLECQLLHMWSVRHSESANTPIHAISSVISTHNPVIWCALRLSPERCVC